MNSPTSSATYTFLMQLCSVAVSILLTVVILDLKHSLSSSLPLSTSLTLPSSLPPSFTSSPSLPSSLSSHTVPLSDCEDGDVRLVNGTVANEGRVEICFNRRWGTICDDSWGFEEAEVTCRQLGYTSSLQDSIPFPRAYFGGGLTSIHLDDMNCFGNESRLNNCRHSGVGNHNCAHNEDAGVLCIGKSNVAR